MKSRPPVILPPEVRYTMRSRIAVGASLALALLAGGLLAAEALKSGPQVGESVTSFEPLNVTGEYAGEKKCQV
jgi:hypothetical protein